MALGNLPTLKSSASAVFKREVLRFQQCLTRAVGNREARALMITLTIYRRQHIVSASETAKTITLFPSGAVNRQATGERTSEINRQRCEVAHRCSRPPPSLREHLGRATGTDRERLAAEVRQFERHENVARAKLQA